ncbi:MAG: CopD family protein, partial [Gemmatimonadota bacterium]|nr:CopD family protein [Gemmatimonadota bacterium]
AGVATLIVTGGFASWVQLGGIEAVFGTPYGRLLVLKLAVVGVVLALGGWNYKKLTPRLGEESGRGAMRRSASLEFLVANVVLVVTAILVRTSRM